MWILLALGQTFANTLLTDLNRAAQCEPRALSRWQATIAALLLALAVPFIVWPGNPVFYVLGTLNGLASVGCTAVLASLSRGNNSRVASLYVPLSALTAYLSWLALVPMARLHLVHHPEASLFLAAAFLLFAFGLARLRRSEASLAAFMAVIPVGLTWGLLDTGIKLTLPPTPELNSAVAYLAINAVAQATGAWVLWWARGRSAVPLLPSRTLLWAALRMTVLGLAGFLSLVLAIQAAPNPGYPALVGMSLPLWIYLLHKVRGVKDPLRPSVLILFVLGGVLALLSTL